MYIDSTTLSLFLSAVIGIATAVLAWTTCTLARETKRMREFQERPRLSIRLERASETSKFLNLVLGNEGQGVAKNVRFGAFEGHPLPYSEGTVRSIGFRDVMDQPLFEKGLTQWESGQTFTFLFGSPLHEDFEVAAQNPLKFHVLYESASGKKFNDVLEVDLNFLLGPYISEATTEKGSFRSS